MIAKVCAWCAEPFRARLNRTRYCSRTCGNRGQSVSRDPAVMREIGRRGGQANAEKFWRRVLRGVPSDCHATIKQVAQRRWNAGYQAARKFYERQMEQA